MTDADILAEFRAAHALLEGHFILSSGLRSPRYLQCARVLMDPARAERLVAALIAKLPAAARAVDAVIAPAMGGLIVGYEVARQLGVASMFVERPSGTFELRRGFALAPGATVLMVEDVVTTGLSSREAIAAIRAAGGAVVAAACLVDRSDGAADVGVPLTALLRLAVPSYAADALPPDWRRSLRSSRARGREPRVVNGAGREPRVVNGGGREPRVGNRAGGMIRLGVNIDHVATIRNARGGDHPDPVAAAELAVAAGADGITAHLREDRRHIRDDDLVRLMAALTVPLNLEMAATEEMLAIALAHGPAAVCIVPEKRAERTTEGGLDVLGNQPGLRPFVERLTARGCRVSLFIEPDPEQIEAAAAIGAAVVELHTGRYAHLAGDAAAAEAARLAAGARRAAAEGLEVHAGHGLTFANVGPVAAIPEIAELNIGHFLIGEAVFTGLAAAIGTMRERIDAARA